MLSYYQFPINIRDYEITKANFRIEDLVNEFIPAEVGNSQTGKNEVNEKIRKCKIIYGCKVLYNKKQYQEALSHFLDELEIDEECEKYFDLIKYDVGDFFAPHQDGKKYNNHIGTILIYPPKNLYPYEGGELYLPNENITLKAFEDDWTMIFLNINVLHEVKPITSGVKYIFKTKLFISRDTRLMIENKICDYLEVIPDKMDKEVMNKEMEELETKIKYQEEILNDLKKKKTGIKIMLEIDEKVIEIVRNIKGRRQVKIICQNYYLDPKLENLRGLDKNVFGGIQRELGDKLKVRIFNMEADINIGERYEELTEKDIPREGNKGDCEEYFNENEIYWDNQKINIGFEDWKTYRLSYDNFGTGKFKGINAEWNDQAYEHRLEMDVTCILLKI